MGIMNITRFGIIATVLFIVLVQVASTQCLWGPNGKPVNTYSNTQQEPLVVNVETYFTMVVWKDYRSTVQHHLYCTKLDREGNIPDPWLSTGNPICTIGSNGLKAAVPDEDRGIIIIWESWRSRYDAGIYAQRINSDGECYWQNDGIPICDVNLTSQCNPDIAVDGEHGAFVVWEDNREGCHVYVTRVLNDGTVMNEVKLTDNYKEKNARIVPDGQGGALIAWEHEIGPSGITDIYTQRVDRDLNILWTAGGVAVCTQPNKQVGIDLIGTGDGGVVIAWADARDTGSYWSKIYAQKLNKHGTAMWEADGILIGSADSECQVYYIGLASDGIGGAIIAYNPQCYLNDYFFIKAQRVDASGNLMWNEGIELSPYSQYDHAYGPAIISDEIGGAIVVWHGKYSGSEDKAIYAQRINIDGQIYWSTYGELMCMDTHDQQYPALASDGSGGAVIAWEDLRGGSHADIYAQRLQALFASLEPLGLTVPRLGTLNIIGHYSNFTLDPQDMDITIEIYLPDKPNPIQVYGPSTLTFNPGLTSRIYTLKAPPPAPMAYGYKTKLIAEQDGVEISTDEFLFEIIDKMNGIP